MPPHPLEKFPFPQVQIRACIFDVDGLLINSEDIYTEIYNRILHRYGKPDLPWSVKALQQSRGREGTLRILSWAHLPPSLHEEWTAQVSASSQEALFQNCQPLPGIPELLQNLSTTLSTSSPHHRVHLALASSASQRLFAIKTARLPAITDCISESHRVFGDDAAMQGKMGKPAPDIFLLALERINEHLEPDEQPIVPEECLVFEDSIAGVEAGRRAGMRVVWVPHPGLLEVCRGKEERVLMGATTGEEGEFDAEEEGNERVGLEERDGRSGDGDGVLRESEDGQAELLRSLEGFPYERYGIHVRCEHD